MIVIRTRINRSPETMRTSIRVLRDDPDTSQYIVKGSAVVLIGDKTFEVSAGDSVYIPSMVPHSYKAGIDGFEYICVVPNKEDKIELV